MNNQSNKINVLALGLSIGTVWGCGMFLFALLSNFFSIGTHIVGTMGSFYYGYTNTFAGSIIGAMYGFVDGLAFGALVAWLYNIYSCCACCNKSEEQESDSKQ